MEKLILLEIGAFSMKACEIEIGRRSRPPLWLAHRVLPDGADQDQEKIVETLRGLLKDVGTHTKSTRLVVTDPDLVVRSLNVPSSDKNELEMTFGFAMTEVLPLPLDELVVDYETTAQGRSANSNVVMAGHQRLSSPSRSTLLSGVVFGLTGWMSVLWPPLAL